MVNHELRNSLAAVYGWAEMMVRKKDPATVPPAALEVLSSAEQAVGLINDLLDLSRLDEDRLKPTIRAVDPGAVARRALSRVTPTAAEKDVRLHLDLASRLSLTATDASRVEQILVNLLTNAIKHTPAASRVELRVREEAGRVFLEVQDEGPGVPAEEQEMIFDVYVTDANEEKQGIGLGLPLSRRLARLLGGELDVVPGPGGGRFRLELPVAASAEGRTEKGERIQT
jgi:signal transduction histidine kinase